MLISAKILLFASLFWAIAALAWQVAAARAGARCDYSMPAGSPWRGLLYNLTTALHPRHKESIRQHPAEFVLGVFLHLGALSAVAGAIMVAVSAAAGVTYLSVLWPILGLTLLCGLALLVRRLASASLRALSAADDYVAIAATCGLIALAGLSGATSRFMGSFVVYAALLLAYLPLGKLRHAVFFFAARAEFGWRLGHRGVYPPERAEVK